MNWSGSTDITILLIVAYLGITCAALYTYFYKLFLGRFVKKLKNGGIHTPEAAKNFTQLGYKGSLALVFLRRALMPDRSLRRYVTVVLPDEIAKDNEARYYLAEEKSDEAQRRYAGKQSPLWAVVLLLIVLFVVLYLLSYTIIPLFNMASKVPEQFKTQNEVGYSEDDTEKDTDEFAVPPEFEDFGIEEDHSTETQSEEPKSEKSEPKQAADAANGSQTTSIQEKEQLTH